MPDTVTNQFYLCYSQADKAYASALAASLRKAGINIFIDLLDIQPGEAFDERLIKPEETLLVLLSSSSVADQSLLDLVAYALKHNNKIIPVIVEECRVPLPLQRFQAINFSNDKNGIEQTTKSIHSLTAHTGLDTERIFPQSIPPPLFKRKNSILKTVLGKLNPLKNIFKSETGGPYRNTIDRFSKESSDDAFDLEEESPARGNTSKRRPDKKMEDYSFAPQVPAPASFPKPGGGGPAAPSKPAKGKVLYDIPDSMIVNKQHKCVVRIGENEAIVKDDDTFSDAVKIETISISGVMKVDLIDISDPPRFAIKTISSAEQEVEGGSYTEWLFWVTPLSSGMFPLILKISILKMVDGKEVRKELVFEKPVTISAEPAQNPEPAVQSLVSNSAPVTSSTPVLKELLDEKNVIEAATPVAFISYAHKDKTYFDIFVDYFKTQSGWTIWTDRNIEIGSDWYQRIQQSIADTDMAVLLISADFISSSFIKEHEFKQFSSLQSGKPGFIFLPILLRDVDFTRWEELAAMQMFVAYGDEYGVPDKKGQLIPFAKLCRFGLDGQLIPNDNLDTYFKNLVKKAEKDWVKNKLRKSA